MPENPPLFHELRGDSSRPAILYLHGFMGSGEDWCEVIDSLGDSYRHLTVDLPGHGKSPTSLPEDEYTMPRTAALVVQVMDAHNLERVHLVGYSMGGRLGLYLLIHYPQRFERAVIESASPGLKTETERANRREQDRRLSERLRNEPLDRFLSSWYDQPLFATMDRDDPRFARMLKRRESNNQTLLARSLEHIGTGRQPSLWDELPSIRTQVLFVAGEQDTKFIAIARSMAGLCRSGEIAIIARAGHNVHWERPAEYCRTVSQFLKPDK